MKKLWIWNHKFFVLLVVCGIGATTCIVISALAATCEHQPLWYVAGLILIALTIVFYFKQLDEPNCFRSNLVEEFKSLKSPFP